MKDLYDMRGHRQNDQSAALIRDQIVILDEVCTSPYGIGLLFGYRRVLMVGAQATRVCIGCGVAKARKYRKALDPCPEE
ncbi:MAG: hypothetical protein MPJ50_15895 [Pirellulales bacterium]|nr:hypothetical protein [Pirellulales bacterium]